MIDFEKQPHCRTCPHCVGWAYPLGQQDCAERVAYKEDGSCFIAAERAAQCKQDAYDDYRDDDWDEEEEPEEEQEDEQ